MAVDCEKQLARCMASRVVYCGDANSAVAAELREIVDLLDQDVMTRFEIAEYCIERSNELELRSKVNNNG